jgi:transglutaminase-like putative cysteine protease
MLALAAAGVLCVPSGGRAGTGETRPESYSLEIKDVAHVVATLQFNVTYPNAQASEWIVFAPQAPALPGQTDVRTSLDPVGEPVLEKSDMGRSLLAARVLVRPNHDSHSLTIRATYEATLRSRHLRKGVRSRQQSELLPDERALYLSERGYIDFKTPGFADWFKTQGFTRRSREGEIGFARRVFLALRSGMQYDASVPDRDFHASAVCKSGRADCGGLSALFASIMRANGIPARTLWGRWAYSAEPGKTWANRPYYQTHVKAEFFAHGVGWVPVDLASGILHDTTTQGLKFFGNDPGNFITFHVDPNLVIDTQLFGVKTVGNLQKVAWWLHTKGPLKNGKVTQDWQVKRTKLN